MDPKKIDDLGDLESLLDLMAKHGLSELEIEGEGRKIRLRKPEPAPLMPAIPYPAMAAPPAAFGASPAAGAPPGAADGRPPLPANLREVTSPMVGTFYRASSPEADPFVQEGDRVEEKSILCIIEAMKVMNEIPSGIAGVVKEILAKNGDSVEFGQPLFRISVE